jgi:hypothetical protein
MKRLLILFILLFSVNAWGAATDLSTCQVANEICFCDYSDNSSCSEDGNNWNGYATFTALLAGEDALADDDIVDVGDGEVYREQWAPDGSGSSGHPIIIRARSGESPIIDGTSLYNTDNWTNEPSATDVSPDNNATSVRTEVDATTGWTNSGMSIFTSATEGSEPDGSYSLHITADGDGDLAYAALTCVNGAKYDINFYYITTNGDAQSRLAFYIGTSTAWGDNVWNSTANVQTSWTQLAGTFTATATTMYFVIKEEGADNDTDSYVDAVQLRQFSNVWYMNSPTNGLDGIEVIIDGTVFTREYTKGNLGTSEVYLDQVPAPDVVYVYLTTDPDDSTTYVSNRASATRDCGILIDGKDYVTIDGIHTIYNALNGIKLKGDSDNIIIQNCTIEYAANDGIGVDETCDSILVTKNTIQYNGQGRDVSAPSAAGDGVSFHNSCTGTVIQNIIRHNDKAGIDHVGSTVTTNSYNWLEHNDINIYIGGTADDTHTFNGNIIITEADDTHGFQSGNSNTATINFYNNSSYGDGVGTGFLTGTGANTANVKNNIIMGYAKGIDQDGNTMTNDYNCIYNNTTQFEGASKGANSIEADPQFTNAAGDDFTLTSQSPCIDRGTDPGAAYHEDYDGWDMMNDGRPDMGALQFKKGPAE